MLILGAAEVIQSLPMTDAIPAMKRAMVALSNGKAQVPERMHLDVSGRGTTLVMPGYLQDDDCESLAVKVVSIFNKNQEQGLPNIVGTVIVLDPGTGQPLALLDGSAVTAIRTAATSAAATDSLARPDATRLAIIGSGVQAESHFHAMCAVRDIQTASFYAPRREKLEALIARLDTPVELIAAESTAQATRDADIVCTTTNSPVPVIEDSAIRTGCHINAIGSYRPDAVEIPAATVMRSRIYVDDLASASAEAGDLIQPVHQGNMSQQDWIGELGDLFSGKLEGRTDRAQITLFKSVGNTVQDLVAARTIVENATRNQLGMRIRLHQ